MQRTAIIMPQCDSMFLSCLDISKRAKDAAVPCAARASQGHEHVDPSVFEQGAYQSSLG